MRFRSWARASAAVGVAVTAMASACGGKSAATPDGATGGDASVDDASAGDNDAGPDARLPDGGPGATAVTIRAYADGVPSFTGLTENVPLLGFQDGDGAWVALSGTAGVYHATVSGQRYGVAVGCGLPFTSLVIYYQALSDATDLGVDGCFPAPSDTADIAVSVVNANGKETSVSVGIADSSITGVGSLHLAVPRRMADVFAVSHTAGADPITEAAVYRGPTLNVTGNTSLSIDLTQAVPLEDHPLTIVDVIPPGHAETLVEVFSRYYTGYSYGQRALLQQTLAASHPTTIAASYKTLAAASRQSGDIMYVRAHIRGTTPGGAGYDRVVDIQTASAAALTMTLPDMFTADTPTVDNAAIPRATAKLPIRPATLGHGVYELELVTAGAATTRTVAILVRPGWAQGAPTVTVTTPDLSQLAGWTAAMALLPDTNVDWTIRIDDRNVAFGEPVVDGKRILETLLFATIDRGHRSNPGIPAPDRALGASCTGACAAHRERFAR